MGYGSGGSEMGCGAVMKTSLNSQAFSKPLGWFIYTIVNLSLICDAKDTYGAFNFACALYASRRST